MLNNILALKNTELSLIKKSEKLEKLVDEQLNEIKQQEQILSHISESVIYFDNDFHIKRWNKGAEKMYGWESKDVVGQKYQNVLNPIFFDDNLSCETKEKQKENINIKAFHTTKDKGNIFVSKTKIPLFDAHNNVFENICITRDITKQYEAEREINKFSQALEQSPSSVMITNLKGDIEYVNKKFRENTGYTSEEVIGKNPLILSANNTSSEDYKILWETISNGGTWSGEFLNIKKNGELYWEDTLIKPIFNSEKEITNYISIKLDITDTKRINKELIIAKEKAEENDRLKSLFLANLSHEIRTPMNSILGFSDLLLNENMTDIKQEKYHEIINCSGKRLMNLINDIADISKIDACELKLNQTVFNLNSLIDQLHQQFKISPKNKNTSISTVKYLKDENSFIHCDESRLAQVLSNLLENALKFTHNGTVEFGYRVEENNIHFYVKDSGVGINAKDHQHIFERFGQSNNEILKVKDGSGLGLAISKGIIELMGGQIWVESEPSKGATFHFTIPISVVVPKKVDKEENNNNEKPIENVVLSSTKTILIAEDEETNFWFLEAALEDQPFELIHVLNGKEAVEIMQTKNHIDLILMDINMPVLNGLDATKEIRKTNPTIPIIAVTAYAMMADKEKALEVGCTDYLSKPVSKSLLLETINKHINVIA